jgi:phage terminase small subunit
VRQMASAFSKMNKKEQLKARKAAYRDWLLTMEEAERPTSIMKRIAKTHGMTLAELEELKEKDQWEKRAEKQRKKIVKKEIEENIDKNVSIENKQQIKDINKLLDEADIPDRWKIFIMYYLHSYNIKYAAQKAGYSNPANCAAGFQALQDPRVKKLIKQIKEIMYTDIYVTGMDVLNEYIKIAFADITEFVEFDGKSVTLKNSEQVDGRLITEVKSGRDGLSIKLADKLKAMEKLEKLFDVIPDRKLMLDHQRFLLQKELATKATDGETKVTIVNDIG